jgi:hypothetical protein
MKSDTTTSLTDAEQQEWRDLLEKDPGKLSDSEKTSKIRLSIKRRFDAPEWAVAFELTGPSGRRADAVAVNTFPSRNFKVVAFEFKASRSDWLAEKRDGGKNDEFVRLADEFYLVSWSGVVEQSEIPDGWGHMELKPNSEQLWKQRDSDLTEHQNGETPREFWGRFVQKVVGGDSNFDLQDVKEARKRGYEEGVEDGKDRFNLERDRLERKAEKWDELQESGFSDLTRLSEEKLERIDAARTLLDRMDEEKYQALWDQWEDLASGVDEIGRTLESLEGEIIDEGDSRTEDN